MKVFIFDLMPYDQHFEDFKRDRNIPYPLPREHWDPEVGARTYEQHLAVWEEMDKLGYDGVGLNEHHTTPHGLMISPNMMAAAAAQRTKRLKFLILGNLLPIHNPMRIAEELAMADCMSRGRILSGFARGVPREYNVYNVPMAESRARFEEAVDIIMKAWTAPQFSHDGKYWQMKDIAIWPRPVPAAASAGLDPVHRQSKETIEWAGKHNFSAVLPDFKRGLDRRHRRLLRQAARQANGHTITPDHLCFFTDAFVADDKASALKEYGPYYFYFIHTLWHHGSSKEKEAAIKTSGYVSTSSFDYCATGEPRRRGPRPREDQGDDAGRRREADRRRAAGLRQRQVRHRQADRRRRALWREFAAADDEPRRHAE